MSRLVKEILEEGREEGKKEGLCQSRGGGEKTVGRRYAVSKSRPDHGIDPR